MANVKQAAVLALWVVAAAAATAQTAEETRGKEYAYQADDADRGFGDMTAALHMTLTNRNGDLSERDLRIQVLEQTEDGDKSLVIFDDPADVKGTALLSFAHFDGDDDQWLYLPALKRVKRIASNNQSGSFMGSEFSYEDFSSDEVRKFDYKWVREETVDGAACTVIEQVPHHPKSGYTKQVAYYSNEMLRPIKIEYYDRKGELLKTYTATAFQQYLDKHWRPSEMRMENHQTGKTTTLVWKDYRFKTGLTDRDFDQNSLERAR